MEEQVYEIIPSGSRANKSIFLSEALLKINSISNGESYDAADDLS
jgi:hypothetical protein